MKPSIQKTILLLVCSLYSLNSYSQNNTIDSLKMLVSQQKEDTNKVNTQIRLSEKYYDIWDIQKATNYANEALGLAQKIVYKKGEGNAHLMLAYIEWSSNSRWADATKHALAALEIMKMLGYKKHMIYAYNALSSINGMQGFYTENLKYTYKALALAEELENKKYIALELNELALIYGDHGNQEEALKNASAALKIGEEIMNKETIVRSKGFLGEINFKKGNYEKALAYFLSASIINKEVGDGGSFAESIGNVYEKLGDIALSKGNAITALVKFSQARELYLKVLTNNIQHHDKNYTSEMYAKLGSLNIKLKDPNNARKQLTLALERVGKLYLVLSLNTL